MLGSLDPSVRERRGMRLGLIYLVGLGYPVAELARVHQTWRVVGGSIALTVR